MIIAGAAVVLGAGGVFYLAGQAETRRPEAKEIRIPATNVGVQPGAGSAPGGGANAPSR